MRRFVIYVHGKGGCAEEAKHYQPLFPDSDVIGFDYHAQTPWEAKEEFPRFFDLHSEGYDSVILIANSIGAYFSMNALAEKNISQAMFISPIVNMERLIEDMMMWSNVTEAELESKKEIPHRVWRNLILGVSVLCAKAPNRVEHPHLHFVWWKGSSNFLGDRFRVRRPNWRKAYCNERWRTLVPYRGANESP